VPQESVETEGGTVAVAQTVFRVAATGINQNCAPLLEKLKLPGSKLHSSAPPPAPRRRRSFAADFPRSGASAKRQIFSSRRVPNGSKCAATRALEPSKRFSLFQLPLNFKVSLALGSK